MVQWQYCKCGKIIDEYEDKCHWCGAIKTQEDEDGDIGKRTEDSD